MFLSALPFSKTLGEIFNVENSLILSFNSSYFFENTVVIEISLFQRLGIIESILYIITVYRSIICSILYYC